MIIAYHAIFTTYGTWLPNDPRGSYSKEIYNSQLEALAGIKYGRQNPQPPQNLLAKFWTVTTPLINHPLFFIDDNSRQVIAGAFGTVVRRLGIEILACAIMNDHIHILVLRSRYKIEYVVNQLKGAATKDLKVQRTPWSRGCWKVFIEDAEALVAAARYIQANPINAGIPAQPWDFITPLSTV